MYSGRIEPEGFRNSGCSDLDTVFAEVWGPGLRGIILVADPQGPGTQIVGFQSLKTIQSMDFGT